MARDSSLVKCNIDGYKLTAWRRKPILTDETEKSREFVDGMPFLAGVPWLDLVNSGFVLDGVAYDLLVDSAQFMRWAAVAGFALDPADAERERIAAFELRAFARGILDTLTYAGAIDPDQLAEINRRLARKTLTEQLARTSEGLALEFRENVDGPRVAASLMSDLAQFLGGYEPRRLKSCDNPSCAMVFYDRGKNNRRRWCSTSMCGNRDKVANYRARKAAAKRGE